MKTLVGEVASKLAVTKVSKQQLASRLGMTTVTLDRKLSGKSELMLSEAVGLSEFLGVSLQEIADIAGSQASSPFAPIA